MDDATWRAGFAELARGGSHLRQLALPPAAAGAGAAGPRLPGDADRGDHLGGPLGVRSYGGRRTEVHATALASLRELAARPNVALKLGGIGMSVFGDGWHRREAPPGSEELAATWGPYIVACIELFGAQRCMFESNFPVDRESCSYVVLWNAFKRIAAGAGASEAERADLFAGTARRVYGLDQVPAGASPAAG
ncbi:MAG: amidohydrolase family protein [Acidimicrobiales bacterium]